ncbi:MAG: NAD(P)-binding protein, partial [Deltaproteobacteria bacterium]|nr:NAD(P)-binding protein [Nannocystaceae bacterium]
MLPVGLQLAPQPLAPPGRHPLVVMFAHNHFSAWFGEMRYHEITVAIPWVEYAEERTPHRGPFVYLPRLWLDQTLPRLLGNRIYGYEKLPAQVRAEGGDWEIRDDDGDLLVRARFDDEREARAPAQWSAFEWARRMLEQPTISQVRRVFDADARAHDDRHQSFYGSTVRYMLSDRDATIAPLTGELAFGGGLSVPGLLPQQPIALPSLAHDVLGAFRMRCAVRVSLPGPTAPIRYPVAPGRKLRVAVLGGGPSACAAAYWLARQPERFEVDVYTMGWRLGGKCAAARNPDAHERIEEHGLHAFPGFYHNAFRTLRSVYAGIGWSIDGEAGPFTAAFVPRDHVGVMDRFASNWRYYPTPIRRNDRAPGALPALAEQANGHIGEALRGLVHRIAGSVRAGLDGRDTTGDPDLAEVVDTLRLPWQRSIERVASWLDRRSEIDIEALVETPLAVSRTKRWIVHLLGDVRSGLAWYFRDSSVDDGRAWFEWGTLDTLLTIAIGVLTESTLDFDDLDDLDFRGWLVEHGLAAEHHDISAIMQVYETLFAHASDLPYRYGDLACGVGLRWFLLMAFGYSGHIAYEFGHACPETLMSPYLLALERHGARVHFFHRVDALELAGEGDARQLARVRLAVQAEPVGERYHPFIGGAQPDRTPPAWPSAPHWDQLQGGERLAAQLTGQPGGQ